MIEQALRSLGATSWVVVGQSTYANINWQDGVVLFTEEEVSAKVAELQSQIVIPPDWEGLKNRALGGDLNSIFQRLTIASLGDNAISTVRGDITDAILTVKIEAALASAFALLAYTSYTFTDEEKALWQSAVEELNFSPLVYLP